MRSVLRSVRLLQYIPNPLLITSSIRLSYQESYASPQSPRSLFSHFRVVLKTDPGSLLFMSLYFLLNLIFIPRF